MLSIFYRRFYILLFLVWLAATAGMFVFAVWGDLDTFVEDFSDVMHTEADPQVANATEDIVARTADVVVHRAQVALEAVEREVVGEVRRVEDAAETVYKVIGAPKGGTSEKTAEPSAKASAASQAESRAAALKSQSRQKTGTGELKAIAFSETDDRLVAHLTTSRKADKITVFWLENPTRLVVDLRGDWKNTAQRINRFTDGFMYRVIVGMHPDRLRVVFKFSDPRTPVGERPPIVHTAKGLNIVVNDPAK